MVAYATVPPDDPFAASKAMLAALADELVGPAAAVLTASGLEELLDERGRDVMRQLLQDHFDLRRIREEQQAREHPGPVEGADGIARSRLEAEHQLGLIRAEAARRGVTSPSRGSIPCQARRQARRDGQERASADRGP